MLHGAEEFKMGIAVAPVTTWRNYDTHYTERFMRRPQDNEEGYRQSSPMTFASKLKGKFLLIHGMADDNVHFQDTVLFTESLIEAGKQFDLMIYPGKRHGIRGEKTRVHLFEMMTHYILENL